MDPANSSGMVISTFLALQHSLILFDRDCHFDTLPQLTRV
jgi:hypothetical protein